MNDSEHPTARAAAERHTTAPRQNTARRHAVTPRQNSAPRQDPAPRYSTAPRRLPSVQPLPLSQQSTEPLRVPTRRQAAAPPATAPPVTAPAATAPPTTPCTVVWSQGRPYVLENAAGRPRWMGMDRHGRPQALTGDELRRRGWSYHRAR